MRRAKEVIGDRTPAEEAALQQVCKALTNCGTDPQAAPNTLTIEKNTKNAAVTTRSSNSTGECK